MEFKDQIPCLLIAMPALADPNFQRSVVLLSHYNDRDGAFGFVINRPTEHTIGAVLKLSVGDIDERYSTTQLWYGGPVEPERVWIIYDGVKTATESELALGNGLAISSHCELLLAQNAAAGLDKFRVLHGYAGWATRQLEQEIAASFWLLSTIRKDLIFDTPPQEMWQKAVRTLGVSPEALVGPGGGYIN